MDFSELSTDEIEKGVALFISSLSEVLDRMDRAPEEMDRSRLTILKNLEALIVYESPPSSSHNAYAVAHQMLRWLDR